MVHTRFDCWIIWNKTKHYYRIYQQYFKRVVNLKKGFPSEFPTEVLEKTRW